MSAICRAPLSRALGKRSLLTCAWVAAKRDSKKDVLPEPGRPTRITTSILVIIAERVRGHHLRRGLRALRGAGPGPLRELPGRFLGPARQAPLRPRPLR